MRHHLPVLCRPTERKLHSMSNYRANLSRVIVVLLIAAAILLPATTKEAEATGFDCYHFTTTEWVSHSRAVTAVYYPRYSTWSWSPVYHWQHKHWYYVYVTDYNHVVFKGWQQVNCSR